MPARHPEELHRLWAEAYNASDLESLSALYEDEAMLVHRPGEKPAVGRGAIREVLQDFVAQQGDLRIEIESTGVIVAGELASLRSRWRLAGTGRDGKPVALVHNSMEVARRQADGCWRYVIDNPFGGD